MRHPNRTLAFAVLTGLVSLACGLIPEASLSPDARLARDLAAAEQRWAGLGVDSYRFTLAYHCFCMFRDPVNVTVEAGSVTSVVTANGRAAPLEDVRWWPTTIPGAFRAIREALEADEIGASFDPGTGVPTNVRVDVDHNTADDEFSFEISRFEVIERSG